MTSIKQEFSWRKLALNYENPSQFTTSKWSNSSWLFLTYRCLLVLYWVIGPVLAYRHNSEIYTNPVYMGPAANTRSWSNLTFWCIVVLEADFLLAALICCVIPFVDRCKKNRLNHHEKHGETKRIRNLQQLSYDREGGRIEPVDKTDPVPCKDFNENMKSEENLEQLSNNSFNNTVTHINIESLPNRDSNGHFDTTENNEKRLFASFKELIKIKVSAESVSCQGLKKQSVKRNQLKPLSSDIDKTSKFGELTDQLQHDHSNKVINAKYQLHHKHTDQKHIAKEALQEKHNDFFIMTIKEEDSKTCLHLPWYCQLSWLLTNINSSTGVLVTAIYFGILHDGTRTIGAFDLHIHGLTTVFIVVDNVVSARPCRFLHFIYPLSFATLYFIFSVIFWSLDKDNNVNYRVILDWNVPGTTIGCCVGLSLLVVVIHACHFIIYKFKIIVHSKVCKSNISTEI